MNAADFRTGNGANLTTSLDGITYIFTIPPESPLRNCSGTAVSLQYCYQARDRNRGMTRDVFNFLSLVQNGSQFTVNSRLTIQTTPHNNICTDPRPPESIQQICCDTSSLNASNQFQLPSSDFTFGIVITNNDVRPLAFTTSALEYRVEHYQVSLGPNGRNIVTLGDNDRVNGSSLVFRLIIDNEKMITDASSNASITTSQMPPADRGNSNSGNMGNGTSVGGAVGGAIVGCVVVLVIIALIVCGVIVLVKRRSKATPGLKERDDTALQNAIYGGSMYDLITVVY